MPSLREIIEAHVPPHLRPYITQMVGKEGISGRDSPTGAAGPLQFTRGTGAKYGLVKGKQDLRRDPVANIKAGVSLTMDNAATLRRHLGRDPSLSELALAHQQGADTAGKMLTGKGNAPANNLRVNNVNPNLPPQEAAKQIMNYYGFDKTPGMTLNADPRMMGFNPSAPGAFSAGPPGGVPFAGAFTPPVAAGTPGMGLTSTPTELAAPASFKERLLGTDLKGGKGTPFGDSMEGLDLLAKGMSNKVDPRVAAEQATITPMSGGGVDARIAANAPLAQNMLTQMIQAMQQRRGR
jgi:hypothetical protein